LAVFDGDIVRLLVVVRVSVDDVVRVPVRVAVAVAVRVTVAVAVAVAVGVSVVALSMSRAWRAVDEKGYVILRLDAQLQ
jgi:hypothetical protein